MCYVLTSKNLEDDVSNPSTTTLSSKGQVVIPEEIRDRLGLPPETRLVVVAERDVVVFRVLQAPEAAELVLRDLGNVTVWFVALAADVRKPAKSLQPCRAGGAAAAVVDGRLGVDPGHEPNAAP